MKRISKDTRIVIATGVFLALMLIMAWVPWVLEYTR